MPLSIDIGSKHIKITQGVPKKDGVTVNQTFNIKLPYEMSVGTPISQISALINLIKPIVKNNKIQKQPCSITLSDDRFLIRNVTVPKGNAQEIKNMALQELVATYNAEPNSVVETTTIQTQDDGKLMVRAASFDRQLAQSYFNLVEEIKLSPKSLSFHSNAINKLMKPSPTINGTKTAGNSFMLLDCGMFSCLAHVYNNGKPTLSRYLQVGFSDLYYHLSRRNPVGESADKTVVYTPTFVQTSDEYRNMPSVVTNQIESFLHRLSDELAKLLRTMSLNAATAGRLDHIFLFGGSAMLEGLADRLGSLLNIPVEPVSKISNVELKPGCENVIYYLNSAAALLNS